MIFTKGPDRSPGLFLSIKYFDAEKTYLYLFFNPALLFVCTTGIQGDI